jgi:hypothetical protein
MLTKKILKAVLNVKHDYYHYKEESKSFAEVMVAQNSAGRSGVVRLLCKSGGCFVNLPPGETNESENRPSDSGRKRI